MLDLFLSHAPSHQRELAHQLKGFLLEYGISAFVAHDDIQPTALWLAEIEKRLLSCDALLFLSDAAGNASPWCNQEIGYVYGAGKPVVSLLLNSPPLALIASQQGIRSQANPKQDAKKIFEILSLKPSLHLPLGNGLAEKLMDAGSYADANWVADLIEAHPAFSKNAVALMVQAQQSNGQVRSAHDVPSALKSAALKIVP